MAETVTNGDQTKRGFTPPYASFSAVQSTIERMAKDGGVPARVDRSYLSNMAGSTRPAFLATIKSLGLIDADAHPTPDLTLLVERPDERQEIMRRIISEKYADALSLGPRATQQQLEDVFRKYKVSGSTLRKAITFFLAAAKYCEITVSAHFKPPKVSGGDRKPGRARDVSERPPKGGNTDEAAPPLVRDLHPFIKGLVGSLPEPGGAFSADKQEAWFDTARGIFRLIYKTDAPTEGGRTDSPTERGEFS